MNRYQEVIIVANAVRAAVRTQWEIQPDMIGYKLPITGDDIMEILNIGPCKKIKDIQNALMQFVFENGAVEKEVIISEIKKFK